uniref:Uncharacterized protein n=1 Tax=Rhodosorus marinus TaxID=101924 RepID=A0A7S2ZXI9_9RHOD|mmetsp:Transcript_32842/g.129003  ORF Transcript_32842/g.129003 Transcript_32842/m.129003 type:complete len:331 (+) Transcript_32842:118-1110(+)
MKELLVVFALVVVVIGRNGGPPTNCDSFELPPPAESVGEKYTDSADLHTEGRILWTETFCRRTNLGVVTEGKPSKFCVKNYRRRNSGRQCIKVSVKNVPKANINSIKAGVHANCNSIPTDESKFQVVADTTTTKSGLVSNVILCFKNIPALESCCGTTRCLVVQAEVDVEGEEQTLTLDDYRCLGEGCNLRITCPNLITTPDYRYDEYYAYFYGTDEDDVFYIGRLGGTRTNYIFTAEGDDFVFGSFPKDYVMGAGGDDTFYGYAGNDDFNPGDGQDRFFGSTGDDYARIPLDGDRDILYGGSGINVFYSPTDNQVDPQDRFTDFIQAIN